MCASTRYLLPAFFVGFAVATMLASDAWGWIAAAATALGMVAIDRRRGRSAACSLPPASHDERTNHDDRVGAHHP